MLEVDILETCQEFGIKLNRSDFICCPFHKEKEPSLKIYRDTNSFYCFGCQEGGDAIHFLALLKGVSDSALFIQHNKKHKDDENRQLIVANRIYEQKMKQKREREFNNWCHKIWLTLIYIYKYDCFWDIYTDEWCIYTEIKSMSEYLLDYLEKEPIKFYYQYENVVGKWVNVVWKYPKLKQ